MNEYLFKRYTNCPTQIEPNFFLSELLEKKEINKYHFTDLEKEFLADIFIGFQTDDPIPFLEFFREKVIYSIYIDSWNIKNNLTEKTIELIS